VNRGASRQSQVIASIWRPFIALLIVIWLALAGQSLAQVDAQPTNNQPAFNPGVPAAAPQAQPFAAPQPAGKPPPKTFLQIFFSGGPLGIANMLALIGLSLTAAYLVFDNLVRIRRNDLIPDDLGVELRKLIEQGRLSDASTACQNRPCFLAAVVQQGLAEADAGWTEVEKAMEDATAEQAAKLFRWIEYLSVIGNLAPMVGLLGTVTGMLLAFKEVADSGSNAGAGQLADGIYQALVTTVYGLIIAIPALGFFAMFRSWIDQLIAEAAYAALHILMPLKQRKVGLQAPPVAAAALHSQATPATTVQPPPPPRAGGR
jgi:biopolymer transport protein ExbB